MDTDTLLDSAGLSEKYRRDVPRAINRLLGQTFLYQDVESDKDDYYLVHRHRPVLLNRTGARRVDHRNWRGRNWKPVTRAVPKA